MIIVNDVKFDLKQKVLYTGYQQNKETTPSFYVIQSTIFGIFRMYELCKCDFFSFQHFQFNRKWRGIRRFIIS